jgi:rRNA biogenesis protein RRP5
MSADSEQNRIIASIRQALVSKDPVPDVSAVEIGDSVEGAVTEVHAEHVLVSLVPSRVRALVSIKNLANHRKLSPAQVHASIRVGDPLDELVVVTRNPEKGIVIAAKKPKARPTLPAKGQPVTIDTVTIGQLVGGRVTRHTRHGTLVKITSQIGGIIYPTDTSDNYDSPFLPLDSIIRAAVMSVDKDRRQLTLSTRESRLNPDKEHVIADREIGSISDLAVGDTVRGYVKNIAEHGLFVTVGRGVDARVQIRELFDEVGSLPRHQVSTYSPFVLVCQGVEAEIQGKSAGQGQSLEVSTLFLRFRRILKPVVISVDVEKNKVELTFKSGDLKRETAKSAAALKEGQKVAGVVRRIEDYGLFIDIEGTKLHGLCHKSQLSDNPESDVNEALQGFRVGDRVKAKVIGTEKGRISLSLKPSLFDEEDFEEEESSDEEPAEKSFGVVDDEDEAMASDVEDDEHPGDSDEERGKLDESDEDDDDDDDDDEMQIDIDESAPTFVQSSKSMSSKLSTSNPAPSLTLSGGFQWFGESQASDDEESGDDISDESDREAESSKKKKKKRKEIEKDLTADMHTKTPETNSDFERLLLGSPNSSYLWIQYMSFQLQISEVDKAREIGRRAVKNISFREEQERLNVWIALLNVENLYGSDESIESTFKDAARANDSKTIHLRLAAIYDQSGKHEVLDICLAFRLSLVNSFCRKPKNNSSGRPRSSERAVKFGHFSANTS